MPNSNPFDSLPEAKQPTAANTSQTSAANTSHPTVNPFDSLPSADKSAGLFNQTFIDGVEAFNRSFGKKAEGALQLFAQATGLSSLEKRVDTVNAQNNQSLEEARSRSPVATTVGGITGDVASSVGYGALGAATGMGIAAKVPAVSLAASDVASGAQVLPGVVRGAAGMAAASGGLGYLDYAPTQEEHLANAKDSALLGAGMYGAATAIGVPLKALAPKEGVSGFLTKVLNPNKAAVQDLAHRVNVDEIAAGKPGMLSSASAAAERQGVPMTPGQLMQHEQLAGGGNTRGAELAMRIPEQQKLAVAAVSNEQLSKISDGVKQSLDDMVPGGTEKAIATKNKLYAELDNEVFANPKDASKSAATLTQSSPVLDTIKSNPILKSHLDDINQSSLSKLPDNSFVKVDALKKSIDEKLWNDSNPFVDPSKKMPFYVRDDLKAARDELMDSLKVYDNNPKYVQARQLSQQITTQGKYLDILEKKAPGASQGGKLSIDNTYNALFNSDLKRVAFLRDVEATGGNVADVKDFITLSGQVSKSPLLKKIGEQVADSADVQLSGRVSRIAQNFIGKMALGRYDQAYLKLTLGGAETRDAIKSVLAPKTQEGRIAAYLNVLGAETAKGAGRAAAVAGGEIAAGYLQ